MRKRRATSFSRRRSGTARATPPTSQALEQGRGQGRAGRDRALFGPARSAPNDLINRSDAFVAALLPGTEGQRLADLLLRSGRRLRRYDFTGRLSFDWPAGDCLPRCKAGSSSAAATVCRSASASRVGRLPDAPADDGLPAESR